MSCYTCIHRIWSSQAYDFHCEKRIRVNPEHGCTLHTPKPMQMTQAGNVADGNEVRK